MARPGGGDPFMTHVLPAPSSRALPAAASGRLDERFAYRLPVTLLRGREEIPVRTEDVSFQGLFLEMDDAPLLRQLLHLKLLLPPFHRELHVFGMAVHAVPADNEAGRPGGVGVQLYALDRVARTIWGNFVARVRYGDLGSGLLDGSQLTDATLIGIRFLEPEIREPARGDPVWLDGTRAL
jgi:hypothetical protein